MPKSKTESIKKHARRRFRERLGKTPNRHMLRELTGLIQRGKSEPLEKQSNRVSKHRVEYQGEKLIVIYDKTRKLVVTVWKDAPVL